MASEEHRIQLEPSWKSHVGEYLLRPEMQALAEFLRSEKAKGKRIYPRGRDIFAALEATPFEQVKVVILGQDPYHGAGQAHGLCFSVLPGIDVPRTAVDAGMPSSNDVRGPVIRAATSTVGCPIQSAKSTICFGSSARR